MATTSLEELFERSRNIVRLGERGKGLFQVLLPEFTLTRQPQGRQLDLSVSEDLFSIIDLEGKRDFFGAIDEYPEARARLRKQLTKFDSQRRVLAYRFDCSSSPVRWANGGMLPIIRLDSKDYFCLFYRDIFPIGWNIANGASDNIEELLDPGRIIVREFGEELLVCDPADKLVYTYDPGEENRLRSYQLAALRAWTGSIGGKAEDYKVRLLPLQLVEGPDQVTADVLGERCVSGGYFLSITPEDNAIEVDQVALINLSVSGDLRLVDGEIREGKSLNRIVGLFEVDGFENRLEGEVFRPEVHFFNGDRKGPDELDNSIEQYLAGLKMNMLADVHRLESYSQARDRFDLCPITRSIIERYFRLHREAAASTDPKSRAAMNRQREQARNCQVFISHRSQDAQVARDLYNYLAKNGLAVFFSTETLARLGVSDFVDAVNTALDCARCMVVLGTRPEYFFSGWVKYEWSSFLNEILSGRKKGELFPFVGQVEHGQLPYSLRSRQIVRYSDTSPLDSFADLHSRIHAVLDGASEN